MVRAEAMFQNSKGLIKNNILVLSEVALRGYEYTGLAHPKAAQEVGRTKAVCEQLEYHRYYPTEPRDIGKMTHTKELADADVDTNKLPLVVVHQNI